MSVLALKTPLVQQDGIPSSAPLLELQWLCGNVLPTGMEGSRHSLAPEGKMYR